MHPNILHLVTATLLTARYRQQYSQPLKKNSILCRKITVGNNNTEGPLEKQA